MKTVAIMNVKGGVGKTITAVNLAEILATEMHKKVLLIDADAQADSTDMLGVETENSGLYWLLEYGDTIEDSIYPTKYRNLDMIPASSDLFYLDMEDGQRTTKTMVDVLETVGNDYDFCIIDCPPSFNGASIAAICGCDWVVIPVKLDAFSMRGSRLLIDQVEAMNSVNPDVRIAGILVTMWRNAEVCRQSLDLLERSCGVPVFRTKIRRTDKADESTFYGMALGEYSRRSSAGRDYREWTQELMELIETGEEAEV